MSLPHDIISQAALGLGIGLFLYIGLILLVRFWQQYQQRYIEGAATTLDAMYVAIPAQHVLYLSILCVLLVFGFVLALSENFYIAGFFAVPAFFIPKILLWYLKRQRDILFNIQLVDALVNISNSLRAGFSLPQALELVHREMANPMSQEIRLVCQELRLGLPVEEALENLYKRMPLADVDLVVTAIAIVRDVGGNLTEVFDNIAHTIRERQRIEGKIRALTAQGKSQAIVICAMPFAIFAGMHLIVPEEARLLYTTPIGWVIIGSVLVWMSIGAYFIYKIVNIDV